MIKNLINTDDFISSIRASDLILVDFYADWCEPCKWLDKILDEVVKEADFALNILKINTDNHLKLSHEYQLRSVPVLMIFKNSELKWRMNGFLTAPELLNKLRDFT